MRAEYVEGSAVLALTGERACAARIEYVKGVVELEVMLVSVRLGFASEYLAVRGGAVAEC